MKKIVSAAVTSLERDGCDPSVGRWGHFDFLISRPWLLWLLASWELFGFKVRTDRPFVGESARSLNLDHQQV